MDGFVLFKGSGAICFTGFRRELEGTREVWGLGELEMSLGSLQGQDKHMGKLMRLCVYKQAAGTHRFLLVVHARREVGQRLLHAATNCLCQSADLYQGL